MSTYAFYCFVVLSPSKLGSLKVTTENEKQDIMDVNKNFFFSLLNGGLLNRRGNVGLISVVPLQPLV